MPIDQMILGPMLDPFKNMAADCTAKGYSGESYDQMMSALRRMEELGQEMDDFAAFSAKMTTENLQMDFSLAYGRVLAEGANQQNQNATGDYDDAALLKQTLDALRNAVIELKKGEVTAITEGESYAKNEIEKTIVNNEISTLAKTSQLVAPIEALIAYGESGVNFPTFLRVQIERGLDKAIEGSIIVKEGVLYDLDFAKAAAVNPYNIKIREEQLTKYDALASVAKFGIPNSLTLSLAFNKIAADYVSRISKWQAIERAWERIFSLLDTWAMAHTKFAPGLEPWILAGSPAAIQAAIKKDKETLPGIITERIRILNENFGIQFDQVQTHETFIWSVRQHHFDYSQTYTDFLIKSVLKNCTPGELLDRNNITIIEGLYENKEKSNPENHKVFDRQEAAYNKHFGAGLFQQKVGPKPDYGVRNAKPWSI